MSETSLAFIGYIIWMMVLLIILLSIRIQAVVTGQKRTNEFDPSGSDLSAFSGRLCRAHANCVEHFALFGGILLFTLALDMSHITNGLAYYLLAARILQGIVHMTSTSVNAVRLRLVFFLVQFVIVAIWIIEILKQYNH
jgi:hypothetical protein